MQMFVPYPGLQVAYCSSSIAPLIQVRSFILSSHLLKAKCSLFQVDSFKMSQSLAACLKSFRYPNWESIMPGESLQFSADTTKLDRPKQVLNTDLPQQTIGHQTMAGNC
uniref:Uncharacterized protein n=1 Tax=Sphaerodactylus townsendi TaxID=933632 RepID=A0ACB8FR67_9SAUR